ncbi:hypothetical protein JOB18_043909, partial [Solea senegalensis]
MLSHDASTCVNAECASGSENKGPHIPTSLRASFINVLRQEADKEERLEGNNDFWSSFGTNTHNTNWPKIVFTSKAALSPALREMFYSLVICELK